MIGTDLTSLVRQSPARDSALTLAGQVQWYEWVQIAVIDGTGLLILGAIVSLCNSIRKCEKATEGVLREFYNIHLYGETLPKSALLSPNARSR
jgi:hypothetical protein